MEKLNEKALKLGLAVYRVTKLFPGGEILISQMRGIANEILSDLALSQKAKAGKKVEIVLSYLQIARDQNWIRSVNFDILIRGYNELLREIKRGNREKQADFSKKGKTGNLNERQKKILKYIKKVGQVQLKELSILLPKITSRTIRNDIRELAKKRIILQGGKARNIFYRINREIDVEI